MTINYTNLLGLAKPVTGTETGQWGDVVNDQITELIEDAVANASSISVTSGDVTLTTTTGSSNQARMAVLLITGSPGVSRNIIAPSQSKWYIVKNSSNASIVVKGSATTGVTILADTEALVFWNGSDFEVAGLVGPSSSTDNAVARFDSTTGKVIQNSGVTIDDSNNVSGVAQLNATTADLTNLEVTNIKAKDGTAAASIADSTGVISITSNPILSGGTANGVLYLNGSKVATSGSALTFDGTTLVSGSSGTTTKLVLQGGVQTSMAIKSSTGTSGFLIGRGYASDDANSFFLYDLATSQNRFYIDTTPNIFQYATAHVWNNAANSTEYMRLTSTGLGIGTSSPSYKLDVSGEIRATSHVRGTGSDQLYLIGGASNNNNNIYIGGSSAGTANTIAFTTNGSERARITSGGDLLVGTTTVNGKLYVNGLANSVCARFEAAAGATGGLIQCINTSTSGSNTAIAFEQNGGSVGSVTTSNTTTTYNTSSDYRLKENIQPMTGALAKVAALKPCTYKWKADGSDGEGFIAHELAEVAPQCVTGEKDAVDAEGKPVYQGIDTSFLVATLTAAIQEQQALIQSLTARIAALESKGA